MSILAGIFSFSRSEVPIEMRRSLASVMSRNESDTVDEHYSPGSFLCHVDLKTFGDSGTLSRDNRGVSFVVGEPLCGGDNRLSDLEHVTSESDQTSSGCLANSQGVFAIADYNPAKHRLTLATDKLGIRPIYYFSNEEYLVFSTALRVLESMPEVPKRMDLRAVTEIAGLGYAIGARTPYLDIAVLEAGEVMSATADGVASGKYAGWNDLETASASYEDALSELYTRFSRAVRTRLGRDVTTAAYLSGGLDSRCVVAALREAGAAVNTFNFARANTQDQVFGRMYAEMAGTEHREIQKEAGDQTPDYSLLMANALKFGRYNAERPQIAWSGEGGSVDLGHVHLGRKIVEFMRSGDEEAAIDAFLSREQVYISPKMLRGGDDPIEVIKQGIREELSKITAADPARRFYLFLMLNDQRRKLASHFEDQDLHRMELQLPFFDSSFVEYIVSLPVDWCMEHKLYVDWLKSFAPAVTAVPWQSYPGHAPCPLEVPEGLSYQWDETYQAEQRGSLKRRLLGRSKQMLADRGFPREVLSRSNLALAALVHGTGLRDYGYVLESAEVYYRYAKRCTAAAGN